MNVEQAPKPIRVLLIEDNPGDARLIREMLVEGGTPFELDWVRDLATGRERLGASSANVVLLDLTLPDSTGLATLTSLLPHAAHVAIILLTGLGDGELALQAVQSGAQDYLVKGQVDSTLLGRALRYAVARKEAAEKHARSQKMLAQAQQIAHVGSWEWDVAANRVTWTDELYRIYGFAPGAIDVTFEAYLERVHPEDRDRVRALIERALRDHGRFDFEERIVQPDGGVRVLHSRGECVCRSGEVVRVIGACQDITDRKHDELELAHARDAALQSARLKSAFIANVSHEIRTPLNMILGYTALTEEDLAVLDARSRRTLSEGIRHAANRLTTTIDGILDISRIETGNFEVHPVPLDLRGVLERQIADFEPLAQEKGLALSCTIADGPTIVRFDEYCLSHALANLLQNAIKFTEEGGIWVTLERKSEGSWRLSVRDSGAGIDAAYIPRLFEAFSQEENGYSRRFEGSGLGLALAKAYVERNSARIMVESEKGKGSVFSIHFAPETDDARDQSPGAGEPAPSASGSVMAVEGKPLILVVEDDPDTQTYMRAILGARYEVLLAASGDEARRHLHTREGRIPMILMDLSLKGAEDGLVLTRSLRQQEAWRDVPIIATTAHAAPEHRMRALAAGCSAYLAKPFRRTELFSLMQDVWSVSRHSSAPARRA